MAGLLDCSQVVQACSTEMDHVHDDMGELDVTVRVMVSYFGVGGFAEGHFTCHRRKRAGEFIVRVPHGK